jgi:uncharacterized membrane protein YphA (DoxX/SURF4 family)
MKIVSEVLAPIFGRILIGGYFLLRGIEHALNFPRIVEHFSGAGIAYATSLAVCMIVCEACGGILLIVDLWVATTALALLVFEVVLLMLAYLIALPSADTLMTHIALLGALLVLVNYEKQSAERVRTKRRT